jgi:acetyl esterase
MHDRQLGEGLEAQLAKALIAGGVRATAGVLGAAYRLRGAFDALEITRDLVYGHDLAQRSEVWRLRTPSVQPRPLVLFLHGGGFQHLDPASHWAFAERFAQAGAVVVNAGYRLAPAHRYPAAADDAAAALAHARGIAHAYGADPETLIVAGTSAGANLALGLAITEAAHARTLRACVLFSGLLQVSDPARLYRARTMSKLRRARIASIPCDYVGGAEVFAPPKVPDPRLDPLLHLERLRGVPAGFPAVFASTGTRDDVRDDAVRLHRHLSALGARSTLDVVAEAGHAFQGLLFQARTRALWQRLFAFLNGHGVQLSGAVDSSVAS